MKDTERKGVSKMPGMNIPILAKITLLSGWQRKIRAVHLDTPENACNPPSESAVGYIGKIGVEAIVLLRVPPLPHSGRMLHETHCVGVVGAEGGPKKKSVE